MRPDFILGQSDTRGWGFSIFIFPRIGWHTGRLQDIGETIFNPDEKRIPHHHRHCYHHLHYPHGQVEVLFSVRLVSGVFPLYLSSSVVAIAPLSLLARFTLPYHSISIKSFAGGR